MMAESNSRTPIINAVGLSKEFRDFWNRPKAKAVNDVDFQVYDGEVVGLLGPNGSGKSTTVKMLLGLLYPTAGNLTIFGRSPRDVDTKKRIGYLPEETYLYKYLTAEETLDFFGSLFNISKPERVKRIEQLLNMVGLSHAKRRTVGEFSKGMQRRIGLAQAMINDPSLLILDEPTSGLDPLGCREVKDLILTMKKRGKTVLVTSHLLSDVEDICDRVIILYGGKLRAAGSLDELLMKPEESTITTPMLKPETMERVVSILRKELQGEEFKIDNPRMSLEEYFLEVINKAKAESVDTAGAVSTGKIADYLSEGVSEEESASVLRELVKEEVNLVEKKVEEEAKKAEEEHKLEAQTQVNLLNKLADEEEEKPKETSDELELKREKEELSEANDKLRDLL